jgi:hypothetical protein
MPVYSSGRALSWFVHLAIEVNPEKGPATWLAPVADEDYNRLK